MNGAVPHTTTAPQSADPGAMRTVTLRVEGMSCMSCVKLVEMTLRDVGGAGNVQVSLDSGLATVDYPTSADTALLVDAVIHEAGKQASLVSVSGQARTVTLHVAGMSCMSCVNLVRSALETVDAVSDVQVQLDTGLATLQYSGDDESVLIDAVVNQAGKAATMVKKPSSEGHESQANTNSESTTPIQLEEEEEEEEEKHTQQNDPNHHANDQLDQHVLTNSDQQLTSINLLSPRGKEEPQQFSSDNRHNAPTDAFTIDDEDGINHTQSVMKPKNTNSLPVTRLRVGGMTCSSCTKSVERALMSVHGVKSAKVNLLGGLTLVTHDATLADSSVLAKAVTDAGFTAETFDTKHANGSSAPTQSRPTEFRVEFETNTQALNASKMLRRSEVVMSAETNANSNATEIRLNSGYFKSDVLVLLEKQGGYGKMQVCQSFRDEAEALRMGDVMGGATRAINEEANTWFRRFCLAVAFFIPILITGWIHNHSTIIPLRELQWVHFFLATPVQFISGAGFYRASYYAIKKRRATMDVLVALSTSIAYFSSLTVLLLGSALPASNAIGHAVMFRVSAMITTMVLLGKSLETSAKSKAAAGVAELTALQPIKSTLYDMQRNMECRTIVPVNVLTVGDVVSIGPNDKIPTDGIVISGYSAVNESMLTGESTDVAKTSGDKVYGGTINRQGSLLVRTTAVGEESFMSQIVTLVNDAQTAHAPIEAMADRISAWFVPVVVLLSALVFSVWYALANIGIIPGQWYAKEGAFFFSLLFALETMVIACPCALGLATPTAVMVASDVGTRRGVLFRGGAQAIESANHVSTVIFDKTGTLTTGCPTVSRSFVSEWATQRDADAAELLSELVLLIESKSKHPLASAICEYIKLTAPASPTSSSSSRGPFKVSVQETPGRGIDAVVNQGEYHVCIGSVKHVFSKAVDNNVFSDAELSHIEYMQQTEALTVVVACVNGSLASVYGLADVVRPEAAAVVRELHNLGFSTALVTGDSSASGDVVARRVGIRDENVHTGVMPKEKHDLVKDRYMGPCFVGDGVNDAVVIAGADVGIAIGGTGSPVAAESADIVLSRPDLWGVVDALHLSKETLRRINLNFVWAVAYNLISVPLAAGVLYPFFRVRVPPMVASGAMALSSTCVILSSLALRLYRPRPRPSVPAQSEEDELRSSRASSPMSRQSDDGHESRERVARPLLQPSGAALV